MAISITISGVANVQKALSKLSKIQEIVYAWMKSGEVDEVMGASFATNFNQEGRPKWKALSAVTVEDRANKGFSSGPILFRTGNLRDEVTNMKSTVTRSTSSVTAEWGPSGLRGDEKKKFNIHQVGSSVKHIPARPMIGFQLNDGTKLLKSFALFLGKQI
jgi:phage gpG-like protein